MSRASDFSALRLYLAAISRLPRLSRDDEIALGEKIQTARVDAVRALAGSGVALGALALLLRRIPPRTCELEQAAVSGSSSEDPLLELLSCVAGGAATKRPFLQSPVRWFALEQALAELERRIDVGSRNGSSHHDVAFAKLERATVALRQAVFVARAARRDLVHANLRLVVAFARKYARPAPAASLLDLIQEGNIGLLYAAGKFDPALGNGFAFYASWWIRAYMAPAVYEQLSVIHLPQNVQLPLRCLRRTAQRLTLALAREPSTDELAGALETRASVIDALRRVPFGAVSLESPVARDATTTLLDAIEDPTAEQPTDGLQRRDLERSIAKLLGTLTAREQLVLRARFGLDGSNPRSLRSLGLELGVTGERVRQIEALALEKLSADPMLDTLRPHGAG
jgi:RNA polymerase sigma factor (sigma-70 family)